MKITTLRFGELEIPDDKIIQMAKPVLGFEQLKKFCIIEGEDFEPFLWFQSVEEPAVAFIIVNPIFFFPDYHIEVNSKEIDELNVADVKMVETYAIVSIPADPRKMSINLQGPILINTKTRLAKQLVLVNSKYKVKHYIVDSKVVSNKEIKQKELVGAV
ncbi:MAG: flagellar assembly protein FliW [Candidatus Zixiibacteriota bacterium]|nr:MAG: flagellar assembly protein FliW [candidate division Zixibacteria bacterium]